MGLDLPGVGRRNPANPYPYVLVGGSLTISGNFPVNFVASAVQNNSGVNTVQQDNVTVDASGSYSAPGGAVVGRNCRISVNGNGSFGGGAIHAVGVKGDAFYSGAGEYQALIGAEGAVQITGSGVVNVLNGVLSYLASLVAGATVPLFRGYTVGVGSVARNVDTWIDYHSPLLAPSGGGTIGAKWGYVNDDPDKLCLTQGRFLYGSPGVRRELGPEAHLDYKAGRYYYGVMPSSVAAVSMAGLNTNMYFAPFYVHKRATFTKIGVKVVTGAASAFVAMAVYATNAGIPAYAPIVTSQPLDAATTGDKEDTISVTLNPGLYMLAVSSNNAAVAVERYTEYSALHLYGTSTSGGEDVIAYSGGANYNAWPTSPGLSFNTGSAGNGNAVKVWMRL